MSYAESQIKGVTGATSNRVASRIEQDIERVKKFVVTVEDCADRATRHAHSLGYFAPPMPTPANVGKLDPVSTTLGDVLGRALDRCNEAMSLFD